ncbi:hypothetical protein BJX62DRAFT_206264 [Aspergillus germanicus]
MRSNKPRRPSRQPCGPSDRPLSQHSLGGSRAATSLLAQHDFPPFDGSDAFCAPRALDAQFQSRHSACVPTTFAWKRTTETSLLRVQRAENIMQRSSYFCVQNVPMTPKNIMLSTRQSSAHIVTCMSTDHSKVVESYKSPFALEFHLARDQPDRVFIHVSTLLRHCRPQITKKKSFA